MADKSKELEASITLLNDKLHFEGNVSGNSPISIDYTPPLGDNLGFTSLELLLLSLSSCVGSAVLTFLRKMSKNITGCEIKSQGIRRQEHPTGFETINLIINLTSTNTTKEDMDKVIRLSEERYCPVYSMLNGKVAIDIKYTIFAL